MGKVSRRQFLSRAALALGATPILLATACQAPPAAPPPAATKAPEAPAATKASEKPTVAATAPAPAAQPTAAPAQIKGTSLAILEGTYFVAAGQDLFKKMAQDWGQQNGVTVSTDFLNWPDLQPKIGAAVQAGGIDIVELWPGWCFLYRDQLVDLTDFANGVAQKGGGFAQFVLNSSLDNGKYYALPIGNSGTSMNYRISWFKEAGADIPDPAVQAKEGKWPDWTWDQFFAFGKKLKAQGRPIGQALGHSTGDPQSFAYPYMWSNGAMETEKDGKTIAFNKPEFVDAMKKFIQAWKDCYDETGTSWDDNNNNRAFMSQQICATLNGSSIYIASKKSAPDVAADMNHTLMPKGPSGRFYQFSTRTLGILKKSKNIEGAKEFLKWFADDKQYGEWFRIQEGYQVANTQKWATDPVWTKDPKISVYTQNPKYGRDQGYAGQIGEKSSLAWSKYIVVDTFAKATQSGDAKAAIEWGAEELKRIYGG